MQLIDILKEIILEGHSSLPKVGVHRQLEVELLANKASVITGVRRAGKSTLLTQMASRLESIGTPRSQFLMLNFFDDRLVELRQGNLQPVLDAYYSLFPHFRKNTTVYFFLDEIQEIEGWESFVDRIMRTEQCQVILSGSSAKLRPDNLSRQMRGRSLAWELFPFSFSEFLTDRVISQDLQRLDSQDRINLLNEYQAYTIRGGFPEVRSLSDPLRLAIHQEYFQTIVHRDVIERANSRNPQATMALAYRLVTSFSALFTYNRLTEYLRSLGHKVPKSFVTEMMSSFEDAYFAFSVSVFDDSLARQQTNPKKLYIVDHGFAKSLSPRLSEERGRYMENMVFLALRRSRPNVWYYKTKRGTEVDFVSRTHAGTLELIQVCESLADEKTKTREISALTLAMRELSLSVALLVTQAEEETIKIDDLTIQVIPLWKFLLR